MMNNRNRSLPFLAFVILMIAIFTCDRDKSSNNYSSWKEHLAIRSCQKSIVEKKERYHVIDNQEIGIILSKKNNVE